MWSSMRDRLSKAVIGLLIATFVSLRARPAPHGRHDRRPAPRCR
jgi:hypothetical protein